MRVLASQAEPELVHVLLTQAEAREIRNPKSDLYRRFRKALKLVLK